jgi:hypothetical protein
MLAMQQLKERLSQIGDSFPKNSNKHELPVSLASVLRKLAMDNLYNNDFVTSQSKESRGTGIEAKVLAELLGCHLVVTAINSKTRATNIRHVKQAEQNDAPIIHLKCVLDPWTYNSQSLGDHGDCLYNAMASALDDFTKNIHGKSFRQENSLSDFEIRIITEQNERLELHNRLVKK